MLNLKRTLATCLFLLALSIARPERAWACEGAEADTDCPDSRLALIIDHVTDAIPFEQLQ